MPTRQIGPYRGGLSPQQLLSVVRGGIRAGKSAYKTYQRSRAAPAAAAASSEPLTGQFDFKTDFKTRRKSKKQQKKAKRRYKRKRKLIGTVRFASIAPTHLVRRSLVGLNSATSSSGTVSYGMYGINGVSNDTFNTTDDIASIFKQMDATAWANANTPSLASVDHRLYFQHATLEITVRNIGTNDALLEGYFIRGRRPVETPWGSPADCYVSGFNKQANAKDPNTGNAFEGALAATQVGVTPFQCAFFCRNYKMYKRQKFRIPPGNEISIIVNDGRPRSFRMAECSRFATDRRYHGILFQWQGSPDTTSPGTSALPTTLTFMAVRRYRFKMVRDNNTTGAIDTSA